MDDRHRGIVARRLALQLKKNGVAGLTVLVSFHIWKCA
jgi:hypothetical protein